jgi:hypothetical protein
VLPLPALVEYMSTADFHPRFASSSGFFTFINAVTSLPDRVKNFRGLDAALHILSTRSPRLKFWEVVFPSICLRALKVREVFPDGVPYICANRTGEIWLKQVQVSVLLSSM